MINISSLNKGLVFHSRLASDLQKVDVENITAQNDRDFSSGTIGNWTVWNSGGDGTLAYDGVNPNAEKVAKVTIGATVGTFTGALLATTEMTTLVEGRMIYITADIYLESGHAFTEVTIASSSIGVTHVDEVIADLTLVDQWQRISRTYIMGSDVSGSFAIIGYTGTTGEVFYFDNVSLKPLLIADLTPYGNHAQNYGVTLDQADRKGVANGAGDFNGSSSYFDIPYTSLLQPAKQITVLAWAKSDDWSLISDERFIGNTSGGGYVIGGEISGSTNAWYVRRGGAYGIAVYDVTGLSSGYHLFVGTYNNQVAELYIDGISVDSDDAGSVQDIQYAVSNSVIIGAEAEVGAGAISGFFNGKLDEVKIWNRALSATEVLAEYNSYKSNLVVS
jgi:hypothetical protein